MLVSIIQIIIILLILFISLFVQKLINNLDDDDFKNEIVLKYDMTLNQYNSGNDFRKIIVNFLYITTIVILVLIFYKL